MTTRAAILIESSSVPGEQDLPGARCDVANWRNHLLSKQGGAWRSAEITTLSHPRWNQLQPMLNQHRNTDYVFITFSGHGYHVQGKDVDETRICLTSSDEVAVAKVNPGNPRCTFIIDSCRGLVVEEEFRVAAQATYMETKEATDLAAYRETFDRAVRQGEKGIIRMFSCDLEEAAEESPRFGGAYSRFLIECSNSWHQQAMPGQGYYYPANRANDCAAPKTTQVNPQQHPVYSGSRRRNHFPLAVCP